MHEAVTDSGIWQVGRPGQIYRPLNYPLVRTGGNCIIAAVAPGKHKKRTMPKNMVLELLVGREGIEPSTY